MTSNPAPENWEQTRRRVHSNCVICSPCNDRGLGLVFEATKDGGVQTRFCCPRELEGYKGYLHGGIIASLMDGTMTNCLFRHGKAGVTAELNVRFLKPVLVDREVTVTARVDEDLYPLYLLKAELLQDGDIKASARAKFIAGSGIGETS